MGPKGTESTLWDVFTIELETLIESFNRAKIGLVGSLCRFDNNFCIYAHLPIRSLGFNSKDQTYGRKVIDEISNFLG